MRTTNARRGEIRGLSPCNVAIPEDEIILTGVILQRLTPTERGKMRALMAKMVLNKPAESFTGKHSGRNLAERELKEMGYVASIPVQEQKEAVPVHVAPESEFCALDSCNVGC